METVLYEVAFKDGRIFRVFCYGRSQKSRFLKTTQKLKEEIAIIKEVSNGIDTIKEFENYEHIHNNTRGK